jgi:hypothetical protein
VRQLQLSFVLFLQLLSMEGLEQWKRLIGLLCHCRVATATRAPLFVGLSRVLFTQLKAVPDDFFEDEVRI